VGLTFRFPTPPSLPLPLPPSLLPPFREERRLYAAMCGEEEEEEGREGGVEGGKHALTLMNILHRLRDGREGREGGREGGSEGGREEEEKGLPYLSLGCISAHPSLPPSLPPSLLP